jgi:N6-L-threonylcarbamoyladenine synthase
MARENSPLVMAIETSCDETAVAILGGKSRLLSSQVASQIALHESHGGVVPEVASRSHLTQLKPLIRRALAESNTTIKEIDAFAATAGPGLATSLMIGASAAKGLAIASNRPYLAINHLEGHLLSPFFGAESGVQQCVALVVSGGHTLLIEIKDVDRYHVLGQTLDDAAGEAFDKVAKLLDLPYPGGPHVDRLAQQGDRSRFVFPRSMLKSRDFDFSFSGLKTSVRYLLPKLKKTDVADVCASFQEAVVDVLVSKTIAAAEQASQRLVTISGGVSCNTRLREKMRAACSEHGLNLLMAEPRLCTDNAAMIAYVASERFARGESSPLETDIDPNLRLVNS